MKMVFILHIDNGKIVEGWKVDDKFEFIKQLDVI
jgi:hypothetical protein